MNELADMVYIKRSVVYLILTENLDMRTMCVKCVTHVSRMEQEQHREYVSIECWAIFRRNKAEFFIDS